MHYRANSFEKAFHFQVFDNQLAHLLEYMDTPSSFQQVGKHQIEYHLNHLKRQIKSMISFFKLVHLCLVHFIWTERQMINLVLNVCFDFESSTTH